MTPTQIITNGALALDALQEITGKERERLYAALLILQHHLGMVLQVDEAVRPVFYRGALCSLDRWARRFSLGIAMPGDYSPDMVPWLLSVFASVTEALAHMREGRPH